MSPQIGIQKNTPDSIIMSAHGSITGTCIYMGMPKDLNEKHFPYKQDSCLSSESPDSSHLYMFQVAPSVLSTSNDVAKGIQTSSTGSSSF